MHSVCCVFERLALLCLILKKDILHESEADYVGHQGTDHTPRINVVLLVCS